MDRQIIERFKKLDVKKPTIFIGAAVLAIALVILPITKLSQPKRSVATYCKAYKQEKARLSEMSNSSNPYPSGVFNVNVTDAGQIATSFGRLSKVAPPDIESEVSGLQKLYQDIHNNPSHAISDSLNGGSLDDNLKTWTQQHCQ
jgi:hypothetical protein